MPGPMPVHVATRSPVERDRATVLVRIILAIPHYVVLLFVHLVALVLLVVGWLVALATGQLPEPIRDFLSGVLRWDTRVEAYVLLLNDEYPPFSLEQDEHYPAQVAIPPPVPLNPVAVLFRIVLAIPAAVVASVVGTGAGLVSIACWCTIVVTGRMPGPLYEALRCALRYQARYWAYLGMLTPEYPAGVLGDVGPGTGADEAWLLRLTPEGRTAMTALIVLGAVLDLIDYGIRL